MNLVKHPTWNIFDAKGKKKETLIHCFIKRTIIDLSDGIPEYMEVKNGRKYECIYDNFSLPSDTKHCIVIISYQAHTFGDFAIIRNYTPIPKQENLK